MYSYLNRPILRRCENISPPVTNSNTMYKFELSCIRVTEKCFKTMSIHKEEKKTKNRHHSNQLYIQKFKTVRVNAVKHRDTQN